MAFSRIPSSSPCLAARLGGAAPWSQRSLGYRPVRCDLPHCLAQRGGHGVLSDTVQFAMPRSSPRRCRSLGHNDPSDTVRFVVTFPTASRRGALRGHGVLSDTVLSDTVQFAMPRSPPRRCRFSVSSISRMPSSSSLPQQPRAAFL